MNKGLQTELEIYANKTIGRAYDYRKKISEMNAYANGTVRNPIFAMMFEEIFKDKELASNWQNLQVAQTELEHLNALLTIGQFSTLEERTKVENNRKRFEKFRNYYMDVLYDGLVNKLESRIDNKLHHLKNGSIEQRTETIQKSVTKGQELLRKLGLTFLETEEFVVNYNQKIAQVQAENPKMSYIDATDKAYFMLVDEVKAKLAEKNKMEQVTADDAQTVANVIVSMHELLRAQSMFPGAQENLRFFANKNFFKYNLNTQSSTPRADYYYDLFCNLTLTNNANYNHQNLKQIMEYVKTHVKTDLPYNFLTTEASTTTNNADGLESK